ncbi:MAG: hypothetical protein JWQ90_2139 [Hydrocarboniphaga sp.]|uniref:hypothetical protein n=1 Tax=Hydrocarboniphaga sp. TaxID=2033016 RepID=UPI0026241D24|nr:hypothetical protein [Hydrocarboniphaga sp.]MDB5969689.1 hypothetical protein [Hydrocarboniphaga sp.]
MKYRVSPEDDRFRRAFEALQIDAGEFDHAAHVRLAYAYLCEDSVEGAVGRMKGALLAFLAHLGVGESKYHETITRAWVLAVDHFMNRSAACSSYAELVRISPQLLDSRIMLTHYSADVLFSPAARKAFVEPNIQSIRPS